MITCLEDYFGMGVYSSICALVTLVSRSAPPPDTLGAVIGNLYTSRQLEGFNEAMVIKATMVYSNRSQQYLFTTGTALGIIERER